MKRIVAVLLTAILLLSCLPLTAMAAKSDTAQTAAGVEAKFRLLLEDLELVAENPDYEYFYDELGQYPAKDPEWILISGGLLRDVPEGGWSYRYAVFGNKLIRGNTESLPFKLGYGVYDVKSGAFYDLIDAWDMNLNHLRDVWDDIIPCEYYDPDHNASENAMYVVGDADADGNVTILDATRIQRCIAELDENPWKDFAATGSEFIRGADIAGATDYDRDGDTTVMDATRIQRTIAELPSVLTYQVKWSESSTTPSNFKYRDKYLVTDRSQLHKDYPDEKRMLDHFDDSYFKDHMLVGVNLVDHMELYTTTLSGVSLDTTGTLNIDFRCKPASTVPSVDMHYSVCLELSKAFLDEIKDVNYTIRYAPADINATISGKKKATDHGENTAAQLLTNHSELKKFIKNYTGEDILSAYYPSDYFETGSLIGVYTVMPDSNIALSVKSAHLDKNGTLNIELSGKRAVEPDHVSTPLAALIEIPNRFNDEIKDINVSVSINKRYQYAELWNTKIDFTASAPETRLITEYSQLNLSNTYDHRLYTYLTENNGDPIKAFNDYSYLYVKLPFNSTSYQITVGEPRIDGDGVLQIDLIASGPYLGKTEANSRHIGIELSRDYILDSTDIHVNLVYDYINASDTLYTEMPRREERMEIPNGYYNQGYTGIGATTLEMSAPSDFGWDDTPLEESDIGYILLINSRAEFEKYFPGFDTTKKKYDDTYFKDYAILAAILQGNDQSSTAEIGLSATKGDTLYVNAYLKNNNTVDDSGTPVAEPTAPVVYRFQKLWKKDLTTVTKIVCWNGAYPIYDTSINYMVVDDYSPDLGVFNNTDAGYLITKSSDVAPTIDKLFVDDSGKPVAPDAHTVEMKSRLENYFYNQYNVIAMRVYQGSGNTQVTVDRVVRTGEKELTIDVTRLFDTEPPTPDDNLRIIFLRIENYGKDFDIKLNVQDKDTDSLIVSTITYGSGNPSYHTLSANAKLVDSVRAFRGDYDILGRNKSDYAAFTKICIDGTGTGFLAVVRSVDQLNYLFSADDLIPDDARAKYNEAYFKDKALVVLMYYGGDYIGSIDLSHLGVVGNRLYGEMIYTEPPMNLPSFNLYYDVQEVNRDDVKDVTSTGLWTIPLNECWYDFNSYYRQSDVPMRPITLSGYTELSAEKVFEYTSQYAGVYVDYSNYNSAGIVAAYNRDQFELMNGKPAGLTISDKDFDDYCYVTVSANGAYEGDTIAVRGFYFNSQKHLISADVDFRMYRADSGEPAPAEDQHWTNLIYRFKKSSVKNLRSIGNVEIWRTDCDYEYEINANGDIEITKYIGFDEEVTVPSDIGGKTVVAIRDSAFTNNQTIKSVVIPDTVKKLGNNVFSQCLHLQRAILATGVTTLGDSVFYQCVNLNSVSLPNTITTMGKDVFRQCSSLTSVDLPRFLNGVPEGVFYGCTKLTSFKYPDKPTYIGSNAFRLCSALKNYTIPYTVERIASYAYANTGIVSITIPENVLSIGNSAFNHCSSLKSVNMSDTVESIGSSAFYACSSLESFSVPAGVTRINSSAFAYCTSLKSFSMWDNVTFIGEQAFSHCTSLPRITISSDVIEIGASAFEGCTSLKSLSIPRTVKTVGAKAAKDCTALERVTFAGEVYPTYVGVVIPPILNESIGESAFEGCTALTSVSMPDEIKTIGKRAFYGCTRLYYIDLPASLTAIYEYTFANCWELWTLNHYGDHTVSLKTVGNYAFLNCESLEYVKFDNTLTSIGKGAFSRCHMLSEVILGENLKTIGDNAFLNCYELKKLTVPKSVTTIGSHALGYTILEEPSELEQYSKRTDFTIRGYIGSKAQTYADNNGIPFEAIDAEDQLFTADITDDKKVGEGAYGTALAYEELSAVTRKFNWDYQTYGDGSEFLSQPYRFAIIRTMDQYNAYFSNERFENIDAYSTEKPIYQVIDGKNTAIDESFFEENALIVGVGYLHTGDEYLYFDEIQQSVDGKSLWFRFNRYTYGDINPYLPYAANVLGYCFAAAKVKKEQVKYVENVCMLPQIKRLPTVTTPLSYGSADPVIPANALDDGYTFIPENEIFLAAPYDVGRYGLGYFALDDEWQMGHILLIRSMAEFEKHFPGFEISKDYFNENALVAMVNNFGGICSEYTCSLSCIAVKDDLTLYVDPQTTNVANFEMSNGIFDQMMVAQRETCHWTFHRVSQQDVAKVGEIKTWRVSGQQPLGTASNVRKDVEGYKLVSGLGGENMAIRVTSPEELETALDRVFTDNNGHKVDRSGFSYADKLKSSDYYKTNGLVVMRVHRGAHNNCFDVLPIHEQFDAGGKLTGLSVDIMRYIPQQSAYGDEYDILLLRITNVPVIGDLTVNTYDQPTLDPIDIDWALYERV